MKQSFFKVIFTPVIFVLCTIVAFAQPPSAPAGFKWKKVEELSDEFNGDQLDPTKWDDYHPHWSGRAPSAFKKGNAFVENGNLCLRSTLKKDPSTVNDPFNDIWVNAAACVSKEKSAKPGYYYEAYFKASSLSMTSSFWFRVGQYSEIDVIEHIGNPSKESRQDDLPYQYHANTHYYGKHAGLKNKATEWEMPTRGRDEYHLYGFWWKDPNTLWFYHDGVKVMEIIPRVPLEENLKMIFDTEVFPFATAGVANIGLPKVENLKDNSKNTMYVDYVHAYELVEDNEQTAEITFSQTPVSLVGSTSFDIEVDYTATGNQDLVVVLTSPDGTWLGNGKTPVSAGSSTQTVTVNLAATPVAASGYKLAAAIRPSGGDWNTNLDEVSTIIEITSNVTIDCHGDENGTASIDDCNVCSGGNTGVERNSTCIDCHGDVNGTASIDGCGVCSGGNTGITPSSPTTWYADTDGDGLGDENNSVEDCEQPIGYVAVSGDVCPNDPTNSCHIITHTIAGVVQTEEFSSQNGIKTETTSDVGGGGNIGYIENGDNVSYQVNVLESGTYEVAFRVATNTSGGTIAISDGINTLGQITVSNTNGWQIWETITTEVELSTNVNSKQLDFTGGTGFLFNINWLEFTKKQPVDCHGDENGTASIDDCGVCSGGNTGVSPSSPKTWYADTDGDGLGDASETIEDCEQPTGYVAVAGDECPTDGDKSSPGDCGCGVAEGSCENACTVASYDNTIAYSTEGTAVEYEGKIYENQWYTLDNTPGISGGPWKLTGFCDADPLDCGDLQEWSATDVYTTSGTLVVYQGNQYSNKHYSLNQEPGIDEAWEYKGPCKVVAPAKITGVEPIHITVSPNPLVEGNTVHVSFDTPISQASWKLSGQVGQEISSGVIEEGSTDVAITIENNHSQLLYLHVVGENLHEVIRIMISH